MKQVARQHFNFAFSLSLSLSLSLSPFFQGLGKEGILYKEASKASEQTWKARYFKLLEDGLIYFESDSIYVRGITVYVHVRWLAAYRVYIDEALCECVKQFPDHTQEIV